MQPNDEGIQPREDRLQVDAPPAPRPAGGLAVPWTGPEIVLVLLCGLFCQLGVYGLLDWAGWFAWFYGAEFQEAVRQGGAAGQLAQYRLGLWVGSLAGVLQVIAAVALLRATSGATPAHLGLTTRRLGRNVVAGLVFALVFAPGAYGIQALALMLVKMFGGDEQPHPFTLLGQQSLHPAEWLLLIVAAVLIAPLWEELVYRGIIQPWVMARQPWGGPAILAAALAMTLAVRGEQLWSAAGAGGRALVTELLPVYSLIVLAGVYALLFWSKWPPEVAGLFATAVLFGWIHARVWPSPVPLLWLALGLGWLRWRSGSLVGPIVLHAVFNGIACVILLATVLRRGLE